MAVPGRYKFTVNGAVAIFGLALAVVSISVPALAGEIVRRPSPGANPVVQPPVFQTKPGPGVAIQPFSPVNRPRPPVIGPAALPAAKAAPAPFIVTPAPRTPTFLAPVISAPGASPKPPADPIVIPPPRPPGGTAPPVIITPDPVAAPPALPPVVLPPVGPPKAPLPVVVPPVVTPPDINLSLPPVTIATPVISIPNAFTFVGGAATFTGGITGGGEVVFANVITGGESEGAPTGVIEDFSLGETVTEDVEVKDFVTRDAMVPERTAIRAICLDDRGRPNPASQVNGARAIPTGYEGEVYRCVSGSALQATLAPVDNGTPTWASAETLTCAKNEALVIHGGKPGCATQLPARECNERSLLRKYGPGEKIATLQRNRKVQDMVTRLEKRTRVVARPIGNLSLDGGVGQGIN